MAAAEDSATSNGGDGTGPGGSGGSTEQASAGTSSGRGGGGSRAPQACYSTSSQGKRKVDCVTADGWWSSAWNCRVKLADPQPAKDHPIWDGTQDGGAVYTCALDTSNARHGVDGYVAQYQRWSATPPAGPAAPVDPEALARRAIARMNIPYPGLGTAPNQGKVGVVGQPAWFWATDTKTSAGDALTASASDQGLTVRVRAELTSVVVNPDDGGRRLRCPGGGLKYDTSYGASTPHGSCVHRYTKAGTYDVSATAGWTITWTGGGRSGTIDFPMTSTATVEVGEAQTVSTR